MLLNYTMCADLHAYKTISKYNKELPILVFEFTCQSVKRSTDIANLMTFIPYNNHSHSYQALQYNHFNSEIFRWVFHTKYQTNIH